MDVFMIVLSRWLNVVATCTRLHGKVGVAAAAVVVSTSSTTINSILSYHIIVLVGLPHENFKMGI